MTDIVDVVKTGAGCFIAILIAALFFHVCTVFLIDSGFVPWGVSHAVSLFRWLFRGRAKKKIAQP